MSDSKSSRSRPADISHHTSQSHTTQPTNESSATQPTNGSSATQQTNESSEIKGGSLLSNVSRYVAGMDTTPYVYGAVMGLAFYTALGYADRQMVKAVPQLEPEPSSFDIDTTLYDLFHKMATFRAYSEKDYAEMLTMTDRLLSIERALVHGAEPRVLDVPYATNYFERAMKHALDLKLSISDATNLAYYESYQKTLCDRLYQHLSDIARRCKAQPVPKPNCVNGL